MEAISEGSGSEYQEPFIDHSGQIGATLRALTANDRHAETTTGFELRKWMTDLPSGAVAMLATWQDTFNYGHEARGSESTADTRPANASLQAYVRRVFGLKETELADLCGVSRMTLYNWRKQAQPRDRHMDKLLALYQAAVEWERCDLPTPAAEQLKMPVLQGRSLYSILQNACVDLEAVRYISNHFRLNVGIDADLDATKSDI